MDDIQLTPELSVEMLLISQGGPVNPKPAPLSLDATESAISALRQIRAGIVSFLSSDEPTPYEPAPQPSHDATLDRLTADLSPEALQALSDPVDDPVLHADYLARLDSARQYALSQWPSTTVESGFGIDVTEPDPATMMQANAILAVLQKPQRIVSSLRSWTLEPAEVTAVKTAYPELYGFIYDSLKNEIDRRRARKSFHLSWQKESQAKTMLQIPTNLGAAPRLPSQAVAPKPSRAPSAKERESDVNEESTASQRIASK